MNDRLDEFSIDEEVLSHGPEVATGTPPPLGDEFSREVSPIQAGIETVKEATLRIRQMTQDAALATSSDLEEELGKELRLVVETTNKKAKQTKDLLMHLKAKNAKMKLNGGNNGVHPSQWRIRDNFEKKLMRGFLDEMKLYQTAQLEYKNGLRRKLKRQVQILKPNATAQEIDSIVNDAGGDDGREELFAQHFLGVPHSIRSTYDNAIGKHNDILALERSVAELHQMFQDFAFLTAEHGELLNDIELGAHSANDHVEKGNLHVEEAIVYQNKIRFKQCWILLIVLFVIVMLFVFLRVFANLGGR